MTKSRGILPPRKPWSEVDLQLLRESYAATPTADIARALGRTVTQVYARAYKLGLEKSEAYLDSPAAGRLDGVRGASSRFVPGQVSWNKGKKLPGHGNPDTYFKKGHKGMPGRAIPIGGHRINPDGYVEVKVGDAPGPYTVRWKPVHRFVWEQANGPIPPGHAVSFRPGRHSTDPALITLDALELVTQQELMRRNTYHRYGPAIAHLVQLRGAITRQINKRAKHEQEHQ